MGISSFIAFFAECIKALTMDKSPSSILPAGQVVLLALANGQKGKFVSLFRMM